VTLTDGDDGVLDLLRKNCHRNRVQARVAKLVWQADEGDGNTQSEEAWHPSCKEGDDNLNEKFDVIIAAEAVAPIYVRALLWIRCGGMPTRRRTFDWSARMGVGRTTRRIFIKFLASTSTSGRTIR